MAGLPGTRVLLERGDVAGAQDVVFSENGRAHQDDLGAEEKKRRVKAKSSRTESYHRHHVGAGVFRNDVGNSQKRVSVCFCQVSK